MIRVLLVDDQNIILEGLSLITDKLETIDVVGQASSGSAALDWAQKLKPDVVLLDLSMPDWDGVKTTRELLSLGLGLKVLGLSMVEDVPRIVAMLRAGARGFLWKTCTSVELEWAINRVQQGSFAVTEGIIDLVLPELLFDDQPRKAVLSPKERDVLRSLALGVSTKEIAFQMGISDRTVEVHRNNLMKKLGAKNLADLTRYSIKHGITPLE
ncbi:MAG: response regulator transcription factor [bacterium]|nr:response regulator transcription factor [bacterium]